MYTGTLQSLKNTQAVWTAEILIFTFFYKYTYDSKLTTESNQSGGVKSREAIFPDITPHEEIKGAEVRLSETEQEMPNKQISRIFFSLKVQIIQKDIKEQ